MLRKPSLSYSTYYYIPHPFYTLSFLILLHATTHIHHVPTSSHLIFLPFSIIIPYSILIAYSILPLLKRSERTQDRYRQNRPRPKQDSWNDPRAVTIRILSQRCRIQEFLIDKDHTEEPMVDQNSVNAQQRSECGYFQHPGTRVVAFIKVRGVICFGTCIITKLFNNSKLLIIIHCLLEKKKNNKQKTFSSEWGMSNSLNIYNVFLSAIKPLMVLFS